MSSEERKAKMRAYSSQRYRRMRANIGRTVGDGIMDTVNYSDQSRAYVNRIKIQIGECVDCGLVCDEHTVLAFAFDHLDPSQKSFTIAKAREFKPTVEQLVHEMEKCELVCHNCHACCFSASQSVIRAFKRE